jgi:predicted neuraminidase
MKRFGFLFLNLLFFFQQIQAQSELTSKFIFKPDKIKHGHAHGSCLVECPNGDLLACWYQGLTDKSRDVHIQAARLKNGEDNWSESFLFADTPMLSDNNPCLFVDDQGRLWLFYYTLLGCPEESWDTAFLRYKISSDYVDDSIPIIWDVQNDLPVIPNGLDETVELLCKEAIKQSNGKSTVIKECEEARMYLKSQLKRRLGWTTRVHPTLLSNGTLILPMASEIFGVAAMALTSDGGETWQFSKILLGAWVEQPSVFERKNGTLVTYMRDASDTHRIRKSESDDFGLNWSPIVNTQFPNPGSGVEVIRLLSGNIVLIYNDCENDPRNSLDVVLSDDEGVTWKWKRNIEKTDGQGRFDYPSIIQSRDGKIHATYSYNVKTIKHVVFDEKWIKSVSE